MRYPQVYDGDRVRPTMSGYRIMCCDCGLVHKLDFFIVKTGRRRHVEIKIARDLRATAATRRKKKTVKSL